MQSLLRVAIGGGGGLLLGALSGLLAAILSLAAKRWRNGRLHSRGLPGIKDAILPQAVIVLSALAGLVLGAAMSLLVAPQAAALMAGLGPSGVLAVLSVVSAIKQAFSE